VDANGCCADASDHRTAVLPINGRLYLAQRFAVDLVQLGPDRRLIAGPPHTLSSYRYYGTPVLSATAGTVIAARDGLPNQVPLTPPRGITLATAAGNSVIVRLPNGSFALYAHLAPGSVAVRVGQRVVTGQPLGRLGNSGNSDLPHLHFQLMSRPSALAADGLPFELSAYRSPGSIPPIDAVDPTRPIPIGPALRGSHTRDMPLQGEVLDFAP
jgi:murein DD-endopeptidase MepM/ murein hydrolase activator NlpD